MNRLVVLDLPGGPAFVDALRRTWDDGDAAFVLDQRLPDGGVIKNYVARVDAAQLGYHDTVFAHVTLSKHNLDAIDAFERAMLDRPEVLDVYSMTGDADYLMRVVARSTLDYERFLKEAVFSNAAVQQIKSHFALREIKSIVAVPVGEK